MAHNPRRRAASLAAALAVIALAGALAGCASSNSADSPAAQAAGASAAGSAPLVPAHSATASPNPSSSVNPGGPMSPAPTPTPTPTQVTAPPPNAKYVPIEQATKSPDGRTLSLEIMARGGACGNYVLVVQQSAAQVNVGLAQLPVRKGVMCPMFIGPRIFTAQLTAPVGVRPVVDLSNGARLAP
ncbi:hypothetical protein KGA66_10400 [Actinocrinis puniceicyclus]|uniref:Lipoprotein n=1 Tax=Actinocrinis puniceicyclus TaxID=977794 RepID=A0A8J8BBT8_9ACTN|nr:hypothetical protein [Actinocrinis puniceicyclus]MBS2963458.1 hypothetical protein [Actinocrinis puniceicyclus]